MQVSKGLKRATGRGEQVQHHLGTLNFRTNLFVCSSLAGRPEFPMAVSPKIPRPDALRVPEDFEPAHSSFRNCLKASKAGFRSEPKSLSPQWKSCEGKVSQAPARIGSVAAPRACTRSRKCRLGRDLGRARLQSCRIRLTLLQLQLLRFARPAEPLRKPHPAAEYAYGSPYLDLRRSHPTRCSLVPPQIPICRSRDRATAPTA